MSDEIKSGDLVMIVRGLSCGCNPTDLFPFGSVHQVMAIFDVEGKCICGKFHQGTVYECKPGVGLFRYQLKKLPPPETDDGDSLRAELPRVREDYPVPLVTVE